MKAHRIARVAEAIREVASETILFELRDPRVKNVTVTRAEVSGDLQHAKVYVSVMGSPKEQQLCMHGLKHAAGFVQSKLAGRLQTRLRWIPKLSTTWLPCHSLTKVGRAGARQRRINFVKERGSHGALRSQPSTWIASAAPLLSKVRHRAQSARFLLPASKG